MYYRQLLFVWITLLLISSCSVAASVTELRVRGSIGPATADYLVRGIANAQHANLILIEIDTPGGLDASMRLIVQSILTSKVPVAVYVAPNGARATSAGTYLLYAATVAAMAPGTHLGAASPVSLMGGEDETGKSPSTVSKKISNDAAAYIRSLAQLHGRNAVFAEKAVRDASTMTASEAINAGVINLIAKDNNDLLMQLDGVVVTQDGHQIKLATANAAIMSIEPDWRVRFLQVITDPTMAYLLLLLGVYGLFFEMVNPGFIAPGVVGAVAMLVALYALQLLPINYAGLALILLGLIFTVAEVFTPSFGALGLGGCVAFVVGSLLLIKTESEVYQIAWSAILAMAVANVIVLIGLFSMALKSRHQPVQHGTAALIGAEGQTLGDVNLQGQAVIHGEIWNVHAKLAIRAHKPIKVIAAKGLELDVEEIQGE